jgi:hypothetical protein
LPRGDGQFGRHDFIFAGPKRRGISGNGAAAHWKNFNLAAYINALVSSLPDADGNQLGANGEQRRKNRRFGAQIGGCTVGGTGGGKPDNA